MNLFSSFKRSIVSYIQKHKLSIIAAIFAFILLKHLVFRFSFREGFNATSCSQFKNCADCANGAVIDTSSPCYWNSKKNKCGSFADVGYSRQCYNPNQDQDQDQDPNPEYEYDPDVDNEPNPSPKPKHNPKPKPKPKPEPEHNPSPKPKSNQCPVCEECPKLTLLKNPTFITEQ